MILSIYLWGILASFITVLAIMLFDSFKFKKRNPEQDYVFTVFDLLGLLVLSGVSLAGILVVGIVYALDSTQWGFLDKPLWTIKGKEKKDEKR